MTSDFPYYLALFGLVFFISVICCCIKLIDIIDKPATRPTNTMPAWNYANYLQNSPVAMLSPQPDPYLRCMALAENHGLTMEEYLAATADRPGLYPSTSRDVISSLYGNHNQAHPQPPAPAPSPNPATTPVLYRINVPEALELAPSSSVIVHSSTIAGSSRTPRTSLRDRHREQRDREQRSWEYSPQYEDICFDV